MPGQNANGAYDEGGPDLNGLLGALLGKSTNTDRTAVQDTSNTTNQSSTSDTAATVNQNVRGSVDATQDTSGSTTQTGSQTTRGTTTNLGTQRTTGTVTSEQAGSRSGSSSTSMDADTSALREVYARQAAGITPEMLNAIFQQGSKAAPNLVVAQSNALGARGVGNTPMAVVLNQLNADLTSRAADINRQMLSDSSATAARIADLTKRTNTNFSESNQSLTTQIQDLLTVNDSQSIVNTIVDTLNNTVNNQRVASAQTSAQDTTGTNTSSTNTSATGTQNQRSTLNESTDTATTINRGVGKTLLTMFAAGVGIDQIFRLATNKGFKGNMQDLLSWLKNQGGSGSGEWTGGLEGTQGDQPGDYPLPGEDYSHEGINYPAPDTAGDFWSDIEPGWADGGIVDFLKIPDLTKHPKQADQGNIDADLMAMLRSMGLGGADREVPNSKGSGTDSTSDNAPGDSGGAGGDTGTSSSSGGRIGTGTGSPVSSMSLGQLASLGKSGMSLASGNPISMIMGFIQGVNTLNNVLSQPNLMQFTEDTVSTYGPDMTAVPSLDMTPSIDVSGILSMADVAAPDFGSDSGIGEVDASGGLGGGSAGADALGGADGPGGTSGGAGGGSDSDGDSDSDSGGDGYADGGWVTEPKVGTKAPVRVGTGGGALSAESVAQAILQAAVAQRVAASAPALPRGDGVSFQTKRAMAEQKLADGGRIQGPGTGVSDSIPAIAGHRMIRVSHGEYIVPKDVVDRFGQQAFDQLVDRFHVPADMQRAIMGDK